MGTFVCLSARRLEQNRGRHSPMNISKETRRVGIKSLGVVILPSVVGVDCALQSGFAKLSQ